jgi:hypothetical protein
MKSKRCSMGIETVSICGSRFSAGLKPALATSTDVDRSMAWTAGCIEGAIEWRLPGSSDNSFF